MSKEISRRTFLKLTAASAVTLASAELARRNIPFGGSDDPRVIIESNTPTNTPTQTPELTPTSVPTPEKPKLSTEMLALRESLTAEINNYSGETAIAVTDAKNGETIEVNGFRPQLPGCVANLACALTVVSELAEGRAKFTKEEIEPHLTIMVRHSNPSEGLKVVQTLGGGSTEEGVRIINSKMKDWEMYKSFYDHPPAYDTNYSVRGDSNWIAASEMNATLAKLANRKLFKSGDFDWNVYALWVLSNNKQGLNFMIPAQIPESEATVAHKVGWVPGLPATINDSGIVSATDQRFLYAITFMHQDFQTATSENNLFYGPGTFGSKLSKITYDSFTQKYPKI